MYCKNCLRQNIFLCLWKRTFRQLFLDIMLRLLFALLFLFIGFNQFAQGPNLDSLRTVVLNAASNRQKAEALAEYGNALPNFRAEEIMTLSDSVLQLGDSNDELYKGASDFLKGVSFFKAREFPLAKKYIKLSLDELENESQDLFFKAKNVLGLSYLFQQQTDSAIYVFQEILATAGHDNIKARYSANGNIGMAYKRIGEYGKAIYHFGKTQEIDPNQAMGNLNTTINMSQMFMEMEMFKEANELLRKADLSGVGVVPLRSSYYNNLASSFYELNAFDSAKLYWKKSIEVNKQSNRFDGLYYNQITLSEKLIESGEFEEAKAYLDSAELLLPGLRRPDHKFRFTLTEGTYFLKNNQLDSAINRFEAHVDQTSAPQFSRFKANVYELLAEAYEAKGDMAKSNEYLKLHNELGQQMRSKDRDRFLAEAKANYLMAVKEGDLSESEEQLELFSKQRIILMVAVLVLLIMLFFYLRNYRKTATGLAMQEAANQDLSKQIEKQKTQIIELKSKAIIEAEQIVAVKSDGNYLEFYLKSKEKPEIDRNRLKNILEVLPDYFVQIHRSYIINLKEVRVKYADKVEMKNGEVLPVSRTFKPNLKEALSKFGLDS